MTKVLVTGAGPMLVGNRGPDALGLVRLILLAQCLQSIAFIMPGPG